MLRGMMSLTNGAAEQRPKTPEKRMRLAGLAALLAAGLATGCAHSARRSALADGVASVQVPSVPVFLNGPMALLFTNVNGFRARVVLESGSPARTEAAGELMGQDGHLLFMPAAGGAAARRAPAADSAFIWNVPAQSGFLLNGPMQAYAPIPAGSRPGSLATRAAADSAAAERIDGHLCECVHAVVAADDGTTSPFRLWRAPDLNGLPLRIIAPAAAAPLTLTLSNARLEPLPRELFLPPKGFTKYDSAEALARELMIRRHNLKRPTPYTSDEDIPRGNLLLPP